MEVLVRGKLPDTDTEIDVEPHFTLNNVAEILCYGTSPRGGFWNEWRVHGGGTPPLPSLIRFSSRGWLELPFDQTLEACGVGPGDVLTYSERVVRTSVVFCKAWDRLNGECVYVPVRGGLTSLSETGLNVRRFAHRLVSSEQRNCGLYDLRLVCIKTGAIIGDTTLVKDLFGDDESFICIRIELGKWVRRRSVFLIAEKGMPLVTHGGSFELAMELKLLLFLQVHRKDELFRCIVNFL